MYNGQQVEYNDQIVSQLISSLLFWGIIVAHAGTIVFQQPHAALFRQMVVLRAEKNKNCFLSLFDKHGNKIMLNVCFSLTFKTEHYESREAR